MSLETLLEAARYVEQLEKKKARAAAAAAAAAAASATNAPPAPDHSHGVAPHSNHHNSAEPRGKSCFYYVWEPITDSYIHRILH